MPNRSKKSIAEPTSMPIPHSTRKPPTQSTTNPNTKPTSKPTRKSTPKSVSKPTTKIIQPWSIYPSHHDAVLDLLEDHALSFDFRKDDDSVCEKEYDTNIMGRFKCRNRGCATRGWSSKMISITIRMYPGMQYNARVYHQRCKACNELSEPGLNGSYAERVAYRLKLWCGVQMEKPQYSSQSRAPHESDLCEGCKHGHCRG